MSEELETAARYRAHAKELRVIAEVQYNQETHDRLLGIAKDYDHMADTLEAIDRSNEGRKPRPRQLLHKVG